MSDTVSARPLITRAPCTHFCFFVQIVGLINPITRTAVEIQTNIMPKTRFKKKCSFINRRLLLQVLQRPCHLSRSRRCFPSQPSAGANPCRARATMLRRMMLQRPNVPEQLRMLLAPFFSFFNLHFNSSDAAWVTVFVLFCLVSPFETTLLPQTLIDSFSWTILAATLLHPV